MCYNFDVSCYSYITTLVPLIITNVTCYTCLGQKDEQACNCNGDWCSVQITLYTTNDERPFCLFWQSTFLQNGLLFMVQECFDKLNKSTLKSLENTHQLWLNQASSKVCVFLNVQTILQSTIFTLYINEIHHDGTPRVQLQWKRYWVFLLLVKQLHTKVQKVLSDHSQQNLLHSI